MNKSERSWKERFVASVADGHGRELVRFFGRRVRESRDSQDLAQEVYMRLLRLHKPELIRNPEAYVFTIAANIAREYALRRVGRPVTLSLQDVRDDGLDSAALADSAANSEHDADLESRVTRLEAVLAELPPKASAVLILHRRDGLSYEQIARRIGVSSSMVKKYLARATAHCRQRLDEQGVRP